MAVINNKKESLYGCIGVFVLLFLWEHVARENQFTNKPSVFFTWLYQHCKIYFEWIGNLIARLSSFYTYIKLENLWCTFQDFMKPLIQLVFSPLYALKGYVDIADTYKYPMMIVLGSVSIIALAYCIWYYWPQIKEYFNRRNSAGVSMADSKNK